MVDWIKCVPFVGTAISVYETGEAIYEGNGKKALWKLGETVVGVGMDALTVVSVAERARPMRQAARDAQNERKKQKQKERDDAQTGNGDSDSDQEHWSDPECEGDKPDEDDVLTDHDKTKAKLNKNLPKGVKTVTLSAHGPIREVSYETIDGNKIVHYSRSVVTMDDLRTGLDLTDPYKNIIKEIGINSTKGKSDDAGHMLPKVLGGGLEYNLFPQNPAVNREYFHHDFVQQLIHFLEQNPNGNVEYQVRLIYNPGQTRPYGFYVLTRCYLDGKVYMKFNHGKGYYMDWRWNPDPNTNEY
ncbi:unnamed protein product [Medioppia subpectinata]|uniref:Type VII secretion system protein EssD-like domain-containing protein n=1 Tax=Medioppia subpectinata TaxID=1979941 RepID=A0A7R9KZH6_9ACAR|nr:unnamed protein product [Medioppia subpectinata]CAG2112484.1 unnamed protein product [Medioppia subpectinata]